MLGVILKQAPEIIPILTDPTDIWVNIGLAIITFFALVVALFQERIRRFWNKAILNMEIKLEPPDCHQISLSDQNGQFVGKAVYIRILVSHIKGSAGENIEIMPIHFWRIDENNNSTKLKHFLPISLVWSHFQPRTNITRIPVGLFRHCDFGHFRENTNNQAVLILDTMVQPNPVARGEIPNVIKPGKYCFELLLSGDNAKSIRKRWELDFSQWSDDEGEMLTKNIKIKEI